MSHRGFLRALAGLMLTLGLLLTTHVALAQEKILRFDSVIALAADGSMEVSETIRVRAQGNAIRRGIFRDFPTRYRDRWGNEVIVDFDVLSARRDGQTENFKTENLSNGVRVYLGREDVWLEPGVYSYEIRYRTNHQAGFYEDFDELYWNVTGNGWDFSIAAASARVRLPASVADEALRLAAYTGPFGSTRSDATAQRLPSGEVLFETTRELGPRQGLTIGVGFPKGILIEPSGAAKAARLLENNAGMLAGGGGWLAVLGFYLFSWRRVGKDPKAGIIIPRYTAPDGYSPAALRYIWRRKYDSGCFSAALVNLAVKGELNIRRSDGWLNRMFSVKRTPEQGGKYPLAPGEQVLLDRLLGHRKTRLKFENKNHSKIRSALKNHKRSLVSDYGQRYFSLNGSVLGRGVVLSILAALLMFVFSRYAGAYMAVVIAMLVITNVLFFRWMEAPTMHGRKLLDHIEGLRLYLGVAERPDLERQKEPLATFEEFEKQLPYAVALDCASTWVDRFESELARLQEAGQLKHRGWYSSQGDLSSSGITSSVNSLGSALGSAISSSSVPPGSSSSGGSGGGGFSGGGGGGGGGGGW
ncbi:MAG: DUF2207 domain-containing protein [Pseudomonadota bacterium]